MSKIWRRKPIVIFSGRYHANSYPKWAPDGGRKIIPYGISDDFNNVSQKVTAPKPTAVFTSNPLRGLSWLLDIWSERISTKMPDAELHIYSGALTYGELGTSQQDQMQLVLNKAMALTSNNGSLDFQSVENKDGNPLFKHVLETSKTTRCCYRHPSQLIC